MKKHEQLCLTAMGEMEKAEEEYCSLLTRMPDRHFGRYCYALFLEQLGRKGKTVEVLRFLLMVEKQNSLNSLYPILNNTCFS